MSATTIEREVVAALREVSAPVVSATVALDDYERNILREIIKHAAKAGLDIHEYGTDIVLAGRLYDINPYESFGRAFLSDMKDWQQEEEVRIVLDGALLLKWHHEVADQRKTWFLRLADRMNITGKTHLRWKEARDRFAALGDRDRDRWLAQMGSPEPALPDFDQMLVYGRSYFAIPM